MKKIIILGGIIVVGLLIFSNFSYTPVERHFYETEATQPIPEPMEIIKTEKAKQVIKSPKKSPSCPAGSYSIGDGQCKEYPVYCEDGSQSEKCI